jgi:hypothetical protein
MTRTVWTLAWLLLSIPANTRADDGRPPNPHLRTVEPALVVAIASATDRSPTFHRLVERLNRSDVVVLSELRGVAGDQSGGPHDVRRCGGRDALSADLVDRRYGGCRRLGILGHELRHAVEIADAASVRDNASLASLYRRIGFRAGQDREDRFDSEAAIDAGDQVEREVVARSR